MKLQKKKKLIFNISEPILRLTQQTVNDLVDILTELDYDFAVYFNSSDNGNNYAVNNLDIASHNFSSIESTKKKINIVASCHKSLWRIIGDNGKRLQYLNQLGFTEGIITDPSSQNAVLCWLGNSKKISNVIQNYKKYDKQFVYIDSDVLKSQVNYDGLFFDFLKNRLLDIK